MTFKGTYSKTVLLAHEPVEQIHLWATCIFTSHSENTVFSVLTFMSNSYELFQITLLILIISWHRFGRWKLHYWNFLFVVVVLFCFKKSLFYFIFLFCFVFYFLNFKIFNSYMRSQTWTSLPPPSPQHLSGSSPCTSPKHAAPCVRHRLAIQFLHDSIHVRMPFSQWRQTNAHDVYHTR